MPKSQPVDVSNVRQSNLALVARYVRDHGTTSRAAIAGETGLSRSSATNLVKFLIEKRIIKGTDEKTSDSRGRPRRMLEIDGSQAVVLALQINSQSIRAVLSDLGARKLLESSTATASTNQFEVAKQASQLAIGLLEQQELPLATIGISFSGPALGNPATVISSDFDWREPVDLLGLLQAEDLPIVPTILDNNANLAGWAEYRADPSTRSLALLHAGPGIGTGIILDGQTFYAPEGFGSEIGHIHVGGEPLDPCGCGIPMCLSSVASPLAMIRRAGMDNGDPIDEMWSRFENEASITDSPANRALRQSAPYIARALDAARLIIGTCPILLGGSWRSIAPTLAPLVAQNTHKVLNYQHKSTIKGATHGPEATLVGATLLAIDLALADPESIPSR